MFRVSARWSWIVLSLLAAAGGNVFAAGDGSGTLTAAGVEPAVQWVWDASTCSDPGTIEHISPSVVKTPCAVLPSLLPDRSLRVMSMSLASGRFLWLMLAACLLSYGQYWQASLARLRWTHRSGQCSRPASPAQAPVVDSQIPTCMNVCQQAMRKINDESDLSRARAFVGPVWALDISESRPALIPSPPLPSSSPNVSAQLGRGPPPVS